jgi:integrase
MARIRYQRGRLYIRGKRIKVWVGRYREDMREASGEVRRVERSEVLGTLADYPTKKLARRALDAIVDKLNALNYRAKPLITMEQFSEKWKSLVLVNHKPSTQLGVGSVLRKHIIPALGQVQLKDFDAETCQRFVSSLALSAKSVRNAYLTLRMMWKSAKAWGYTSHDPFDGIVLPKRGPRRAVSFSVEQVQKILAAAIEPQKTFYWLAAETGMRAGELAGITVEDLDLENGTIQVKQSVWRGKIQTPKSECAVRSLALSPELAEHVRAFLTAWKPNQARLLFSSRNGTPWDTGLLVKRKFHKLLDTLEIPRCGLHAFRHAAASIMDRLDTPLKTRQSRLGHADPLLTLQTYTHAAGEDDRRIAAQLGRTFGTWAQLSASQLRPN